MGRTEPVHTAPPNHTRRAERAGRARESIRKAIPELLRSYPRARHGVHKSERITDPPASSTASVQSAVTGKTHIKIRLCCADTLSAAAALSGGTYGQRTKLSAQQRPNVAILNFASPLRPGGGFLDGANSQEEFLCARTTLYPSLWDSFYRLPELGGVFTPDVLVFRDSTPQAAELRKKERFFIDVISAGMLRFPDINRQISEEGEAGCTCGVSYCDRDRELVANKMRAVMRIAESKGHKTLVLGAWGCGAYGNPVADVAKIWRKVIAGNPRQRRPNAEAWSSISEIVFAIPDRNMLNQFEHAFSDLVSHEPLVATSRLSGNPLDVPKDPDSELLAAISSAEAQLAGSSNAHTKERLRDLLAKLNQNLEREEAMKRSDDTDLTQEEDEELAGRTSSDPDSSNLYNFDENDVASDSSEGERSEVYDFSTSKFAGTAQHRNGEDCIAEPSPNFDTETGWFSGSMDDLSRMLRLSSPDKDVSTADSSDEEHRFNERAVDAYLTRYGGTDAISSRSSVR